MFNVIHKIKSDMYRAVPLRIMPSFLFQEVFTSLYSSGRFW